MTKPAVWVQFIIKKNNGGENNLLHLKYPTCRKLWLFLFCNYKDLRSQIVLSYPYPQLRLICGSFEFRSNYGKSMEVDLRGSQSEKNYLSIIVPVFFRVNKKTKRENILLDVVNWVVLLNSYKHDKRNSSKTC